MDPSKEGPELHFEPPGPGSWELDAVHFPVPRHATDGNPSRAFQRGVREFTRFYGMLIDGLDMAMSTASST